MKTLKFKDVEIGQVFELPSSRGNKYQKKSFGRSVSLRSSQNFYFDQNKMVVYYSIVEAVAAH